MDEGRFSISKRSLYFRLRAETAPTVIDDRRNAACEADDALIKFLLAPTERVADPALDALAPIVRGADIARLEPTPQSPRLLAVSLGLSSIYRNDHDMPDRAMIVCDALYAWCRDCRDQGHDWKPALMAKA